jgi:hypothetical protein
MDALEKCLVVIAALYVFALPWTPWPVDVIYAVFVAYVLVRVRRKSWAGSSRGTQQ